MRDEQVGARDSASAKRALQARYRARIVGQHQQARGAAVDAVHQAAAELARHLFARQAARLVDDDDASFIEQYVHVDVTLAPGARVGHSQLAPVERRSAVTVSSP